MPVVKPSPSGEVNWWRSELGSLATSTTWSWLGRLATNLGVPQPPGQIGARQVKSTLAGQILCCLIFFAGCCNISTRIKNHLTRERAFALNCALTDALISTIFSCFKDCHPVATGDQTFAICLECGIQLHREVAHPLTLLV